jgi:hypothetical protein
VGSRFRPLLFSWSLGLEDEGMGKIKDGRKWKERNRRRDRKIETRKDYY